MNAVPVIVFGVLILAILAVGVILSKKRSSPRLPTRPQQPQSDDGLLQGVMLGTLLNQASTPPPEHPHGSSHTPPATEQHHTFPDTSHHHDSSGFDASSSHSHH